ncbi:MAG: DUF721 domain-containing protein [Leptospirales bacterium]|nr:DUF721 domain-containing protein [Leptospirales bacterium]
MSAFTSESEVQDITLLSLQSRWPDIVGPIARHSYPAEVRGHRVYVRIEKAVYAQDFNLIIPQVLRVLKSITPSIKEIVVQKGRFEPGGREVVREEQTQEQANTIPTDVKMLLNEFRSGK